MFKLPTRLNDKRTKQLLSLYGASFISIILGIAVSVTTTRLLGKEEFGNFRYISNIFMFLSSLVYFGFFVTGGRVLATNKEENNAGEIKGALILLSICSFIVLLVSIIIAVVVHFYLGQNNIALSILIVSPLAIGYPLQNMLENVYQGENKIYSLSILRTLSQFLFLVISLIIFNTIKINGQHALMLQLSLNLIVLICLIYLIKPSFKRTKTYLIQLFHENKNYGFHVYIGSLLAVSTSYIAGITLGLFNNTVQVGYFTLAVTISGPITLIPGIIGTTYFKDFSEMKRIPSKLMLNAIFFSSLVLVVFCLLSKYLVNFLYGKEYEAVVGIVIPLAIGALIHGFGDLFNRFWGAQGRGKILRNVAALVGLCVIFGNTVITYFFQINGAVITKVLGSIVYLSGMLYYYYRIKI